MTPLDAYENFMRSFANTFREYILSGSILEIIVGLGPAVNFVPFVLNVNLKLEVSRNWHSAMLRRTRSNVARATRE